MKTVVIIWEDDVDIRTKSAVEQIVNAWEDFAFGYDIDASEEICAILDELDIKYTVEEDI